MSAFRPKSVAVHMLPANDSMNVLIAIYLAALEHGAAVALGAVGKHPEMLNILPDAADAAAVTMREFAENDPLMVENIRANIRAIFADEVLP